MTAIADTTLRFHDTLSGEKRPFRPQNESRVTMYVCGPTVYNYAHIGNARPAVVFDVLFRLLRARYGDGAVEYARNITDVDDKIINRAKETGEAISEITAKFSDIYRADMGALGVLTPTHEPTATGHIGEMIGLVQTLIDEEAAYAKDGHVLFSIAAFERYGALSNVDRDEMIAGARVEVAPYKKDAADFVLWKPSADDEPGWDSPWGRGRPGWHLECSAMIEKNLGRTIDIHGGGHDLRFPHHENEIAQSACAHQGAPLANYWLHNGFLRMGKDKMSKSLGNVVLVHDLLEDWDGEVIRWALLSAHYRQPLEWTEDLLAQSKKQLDRFYRVLADLGDVPASDDATPPAAVAGALGDDLNTPEAFAALHGLRDAAAKASGAGRADAKAALLAGGALLGFLGQDPEEWFKGAAKEGALADEEIDRLLTERAEARKAKDFARADEIRDTLTEQGIVIEDGAAGATWRRG